MSSKVVRVGESNVPGAGRGIYARVDLRRGDVLCKVYGPVLTEEEAAEYEARCKDGSRYFLGLGDGRIMIVKGPGRYANDARGPVRVPGLRNNCRFVEDEDGAVWLEATRAIPAGSECLVPYGAAYWAAMADRGGRRS